MSFVEFFFVLLEINLLNIWSSSLESCIWYSSFFFVCLLFLFLCTLKLKFSFSLLLLEWALLWVFFLSYPFTSLDCKSEISTTRIHLFSTERKMVELAKFSWNRGFHCKFHRNRVMENFPVECLNPWIGLAFLKNTTLHAL